MSRRTVGTVLGAGLLALGACAAQRQSDASEPTSSGTETTTVTTSTEPEPTTTTTTTTTEPPSTSAAPPTSTTSPPTTSTTTTSTTTTSTTTTTAPPLPVEHPKCVVEVQPGDSLSLIAEAVDDGDVTVEALQVENEISDRNTIHAGAYIDICVGNEIDDITGEKRTPAPPPAEGGGTGVVAQQQKINELFAGTLMPALTLDGDSGSLTQQQLCAARIALGQPASRNDMQPGSDEENLLMSAGGLSIPSGAPVSAGRWALIDLTCQIMFVGNGEEIVFVFPTSTGEPGYETRDQNGSPVFRYDPARDNNGWHDSTSYPVEVDNPLNGNMYLPLYFDRGQAIHGANNVPPNPQSKGCARLRVEHQDALIDWLGLRDVAEPTWDESHIGLTVTVQGQF